MAALILGMMVGGWTARSLPFSPLKVQIFFWHKSFGLLLLLLVMVRIAWRLRCRRPAWPASMPHRERQAAAFTHLALYLLMVITPLSGWVINSAAKIPFQVFGLWRLPAIVAPDDGLQSAAEWVHLGCFVLFALLLTLHIGAALRHHFVLRDAVLREMLPRRWGRPATRSGDRLR